MSAESKFQWQQFTSGMPTQTVEALEKYANCLLEKTLDALAQSIDRRDPLTAGHSIRVTNYSLLIARALAVSEDELVVLRYSAMLHDYGKLGVPECILWKNSRPTPEEHRLIQMHAKMTYDLLSNLPFTSKLAEVPLIASSHHENLDGSGYPRGLVGDQIPFLARIIAVANVFDNLTSIRHYRERIAIAIVDKLLQAQRETQLDARVLDALYGLPADQVLEVMESERGRIPVADFGAMKSVSWRRLLELCHGQKPSPEEKNVVETFDRIYNANPLFLPEEVASLD